MHVDNYRQCSQLLLADSHYMDKGRPRDIPAGTGPMAAGLPTHEGYSTKLQTRERAINILFYWKIIYKGLTNPNNSKHKLKISELLRIKTKLKYLILAYLPA